MLLNGFHFSFFPINPFSLVRAVDETDFLSVFGCTLNICILILKNLLEFSLAIANIMIIVVLLLIRCPLFFYDDVIIMTTVKITLMLYCLFFPALISVAFVFIAFFASGAGRVFKRVVKVKNPFKNCQGQNPLKGGQG